MEKMFAALFSSVLLAGAATTASAQTSSARTPPPAGWVLAKQVDKRTGAQSFTMVRYSDEGPASLMIHCADGSYVAFIAVPKAVAAGRLTRAEVHFDKREAIGFTLQRSDEASLVSAIADAKVVAFYVFMTDDAKKAAAGNFSADERARMGMAVVNAVRSSSQMIFRMSLAAAGRSTEATFNLSGFAEAAAPMLKACPVQ